MNQNAKYREEERKHDFEQSLSESDDYISLCDDTQDSNKKICVDCEEYFNEDELNAYTRDDSNDEICEECGHNRYEEYIEEKYNPDPHPFSNYKG